MTTRRQLAGLGLAAAGATGLGLATGSPARAAVPAAAPVPEDVLALTARRTQITLPALPTLGLTYIATLDLFDAAGTRVGQAWSGASVVELNLSGPVVLATVVLRLTDGEIQYQRVMNRFGDYPRSAAGAILGGTGTYQNIRGQVTVTWPDADVVNLEINYSLV